MYMYIFIYKDYDCNEGGYNWPLRCVDFVFAKICVDTDDQSGTHSQKWSL